MMIQIDLLGFLAEGFLQQGASVSYKEIMGIPALSVITEAEVPQLFISPEEEVSKIAFLEQLASEEINIPVFKAEEEIKLKTALFKSGIRGIKVYRLSLQQRYSWYSREFISKKLMTAD